jgi:hypothetical protein
MACLDRWASFEYPKYIDGKTIYQVMRCDPKEVDNN